MKRVSIAVADKRIIDFSEIAVANRGGERQDEFEQFACEFLQTMGFKIITRPDRGADGKKDFIVNETRQGKEGDTIIKWLVSCKHYKTRKSGVKDTDEPDISDRVKRHKCDGFMGVYSSIANSSLTGKLSGLDGVIYSIYDGVRIEQEILKCKDKDIIRLLRSFFPNSFEKYRETISIISPENERKPSRKKHLTEEDVLRITTTAMILLEIEKIQEEFSSPKWEREEELISKLDKFLRYNNEKVADRVLEIIDSIADRARSKMPDEIAGSVFFSILSFYPSSYEASSKVRTELGKKCINMGFSMAYDAFIYLNDIKVAEWGLNILKFIYREAKQKKMSELKKEVHQQYAELEDALERPERNDLQYAKDIVKVFKDDLESGDLSFPVLPPHLHKLKYGKEKP
jgi:hypothetical protein